MDSRSPLNRLHSNLSSAVAPARSHTDPAITSPEKGKLAKRQSNRLHSKTIGAHDARSHHHQTPFTSHSHSQSNGAGNSNETGTTSGNSTHRHRQRARDTVHSAMELRPPVSFEHLLRRDKKGPAMSRQGSAEQHAADVEAWRAEQAAMAREQERRRVKPHDVAVATAENVKREEALQQRLKAAEDVGMQSTRQLDDTYYTILEKAAGLRATVNSLMQLAEEGRRLHEDFRGDSRALEEKTRRDLSALNGFQRHEETIKGLVFRLKVSKAKTEKLNARLEATRMRVSAYEKRENAKEIKRRKQWNATWATLLGALVFLVILVIFKHHKSIALPIDEGGLSGLLGDQQGRLFEGVLPNGKKTARSRASPSPSEDPYLQKLFDEL